MPMNELFPVKQIAVSETLANMHINQPTRQQISICK